MDFGFLRREGLRFVVGLTFTGTSLPKDFRTNRHRASGRGVV